MTLRVQLISSYVPITLFSTNGIAPPPSTADRLAQLIEHRKGVPHDLGSNPISWRSRLTTLVRK